MTESDGVYCNPILVDGIVELRYGFAFIVRTFNRSIASQTPLPSVSPNVAPPTAINLRGVTKLYFMLSSRKSCDNNRLCVPPFSETNAVPAIDWIKEGNVYTTPALVLRDVVKAVNSNNRGVVIFARNLRVIVASWIVPVTDDCVEAPSKRAYTGSPILWAEGLRLYEYDAQAGAIAMDIGVSNNDGS